MRTGDTPCTGRNAALFPLVSIPMMEKHNMQRRKDYAEYMRHTSRLLLLQRRH